MAYYLPKVNRRLKCVVNKTLFIKRICLSKPEYKNIFSNISVSFYPLGG